MTGRRPTDPRRGASRQGVVRARGDGFRSAPTRGSVVGRGVSPRGGGAGTGREAPGVHQPRREARVLVPRAEARALDRQAVVRGGELDRRDGVRDGARGAIGAGGAGLRDAKRLFRRDENDAPRRRAEERRGVPPRGSARGAQDARAAAGGEEKRVVSEAGEREREGVVIFTSRTGKQKLHLFLHHMLKDKLK